jgi:hypothetical protein
MNGMNNTCSHLMMQVHYYSPKLTAHGVKGMIVHPSSLDYRSEHFLQLALEKYTCIVMCPEF